MRLGQCVISFPSVGAGRRGDSCLLCLRAWTRRRCLLGALLHGWLSVSPRAEPGEREAAEVGTSHHLPLHQVCQLWAKPCALPGLLWKSGRHPTRSSPCWPLPWAGAATPPSCPCSFPPNDPPLPFSPLPAFFLLPLPLLLPSLPPSASCRVAELWNILLPLDAPAQVCDPPAPTVRAQPRWDVPGRTSLERAGKG